MARKKTTRKGNGDGSITKRPNGTYMGQIMIGRDSSNGKRIIKSVYGKTKKEVKDKLTKIQIKLISNSYYEPSKLNVKDWLEQWLDIYKVRSTRIQTRELYRSLIKSIISPYMGNMKIKYVKPITIQD